MQLYPPSHCVHLPSFLSALLPYPEPSSWPPAPYSGFAADWDFFGEQFERAFTRWPLAVGMGNHERDWPGTGDAFNNTSSDSGVYSVLGIKHILSWVCPAVPPPAGGESGTPYASLHPEDPCSGPELRGGGPTSQQKKCYYRQHLA